MMKALALTTLAVVCLGAHCRPIDGCVLGATRCTGNAAEICDADGGYHELADCDNVSERSGAPFVCAHVDETTEDGHITGHTCVPASDADAAAGGGR
ncbi:hypothetical protein [Corallococcus sp. EGB]|uniref:hypothetical protein n=1 Tax=Corallococcus sp. EGB TaxID=1521117 RepID=UPI001CBBF087|nr:hypothetical protein [Corallococcus sp. EGB]